jgi:ketosteroid isomerase-like protein
MGGLVAQRIDDDGDHRRRRVPSEWLLAWMPSLYRLLGRAYVALRPESRFRRWIIRWQAVSGWAAWNRRDFKLMRIRYTEDLVFEYAPELVTLGLPQRTEGRDLWLTTLEEFLAPWDETSYTLQFAVDLGERLILIGRASFRGRASGAELEFDFCQLLEMRASLAAHERDFNDRRAAIAAAGLAPALVDRLEALPAGGMLRLESPR